MGTSRSFSDKFTISGIAFFFCCLVIAGLFTTHFARSLSSIGTIGLGVVTLFAFRKQRIENNLSDLLPFIGFILIYTLHLTGFFLGEIADDKTFTRDLVMKLPLLVLPLAFAFLPVISKAQLQRLYLFFVICVFAGSLYSTGYYLLHFDHVNELYKHSDVMETPTNHVRYSLMVAFAIIVGFRYYRAGVYWFGNWERKILLIITAWLFIFLHILAVRSGLVAFYAVVGLGLAFDFFFRKQYKRSVLLGLSLGIALVAAFYTLPTFYNKFYLTIADVESVSEAKNAHDYSIAGRVYSYKVAMAVFKDNPVLGVGVGNMDSELAKKYGTMFPEILDRGHLLPHNQFLYTLTAFGVVGFLIFMIGFYYSFFRFLTIFEPLFLLHYIIITLSFLFETTLETQVGLTYSIIFILLPLWYFRAHKPGDFTWKNGSFFV